MMMGLVCKILEAIIARAFTIALCHDASSFTNDLAPPFRLMRFFDESCTTGSLVVKNDFVSTANRTPKTDANLVEINLKHMAKSAMQGVPKRFPRLTVGWPGPLAGQPFYRTAVAERQV